MLDERETYQQNILKRSLGEASDRVSGKRIIERLAIAVVAETIDNANTSLLTPVDID